MIFCIVSACEAISSADAASSSDVAALDSVIDVFSSIAAACSCVASATELKLAATCSMFAIIDFKPGRYRVTLKEINTISTTGNVGTKEPLATFAYHFKKKKWRSSFNTPALVYEYSFTEIFTIKESVLTDW
jgi:hypothetical protein